MAYVRRKGNQLAIVHGVRNGTTKQVEQSTLFSIYSKAEALAALGSEKRWFREMVQAQGPDIRFDWTKIEAGIRGNLDHLPDLYRYKDERVEGSFRGALCAFTRELMLCDPQTLFSSAQTLQRQRHELTYLRDLIDVRLKLADQEPNEWNQDNPFYWRTRSLRQDAPVDTWQRLAMLYDRQRYAEAEALARLLTECWPNFARGFNYLGRIALQDERLDEALKNFEEAIRVGRASFPKKFPKDQYWVDHDTRPYIRAIIHKARTLNRIGRYEDALALCLRLEQECGQDITADVERASICLNSGDWAQAVASAGRVAGFVGEVNFHLAFGHFEAGERDEALVRFLHAFLSFPRTARLLADVRKRGVPKALEDVEDHNIGVQLQKSLQNYLQHRGSAATKFLTQLVTLDEVEAFIEELKEVRQRCRQPGSNDRSAYDRMTQMTSLTFAREQADMVARAIARLGGAGRTHRRRNNGRRG